MEKCEHEIKRTGGMGFVCTYYTCIGVQYMYIYWYTYFWKIGSSPNVHQ